MRTDRRGQALVELACGLMTVALVLSVLCCFIRVIVGNGGTAPHGALEVQNAQRGRVGATARTLGADAAEEADERHAVDSVMQTFLSEFGFGSAVIGVRERVFVPGLRIL